MEFPILIGGAAINPPQFAQRIEEGKDLGPYQAGILL